jgi:HK97 family phage major capsid protein
MNIIAALKEPYHTRAVWMMKRATIAQAMQVADGDSSFVFAPMIFQGERSPLSMTIMGYPIRFGDDLPAIASNALSYIFGDIGATYTIVDRRGIRVLRNPYLEEPFVIFSTTKRVGGAVVNFESVKIGKCAT